MDLCPGRQNPRAATGQGTRGRGFDSRSPRYRVHPWASCSHTCASVTKQYNLVPVQAGKVTVGLASHWPCVADNSGITTYGLTALEREMSILYANCCFLAILLCCNLHDRVY